MNLEYANFHQVVDNSVVFMTNLVKGYGEIHMFLEHPVDEPIEMEVEDVEPLEFRDPGEVDLADAQALEVINNAVDDEFVVYGVSSDSDSDTNSNSESDHYHEHAKYRDDSYHRDDNDHRAYDDYRYDFSNFGEDVDDDHRDVEDEKT